MIKRIIIGFTLITLFVVSVYWFSINKNVRFLILNQPTSDNPLFWTTPQRDAAFQSIELLQVLPFKTIEKSDIPPSLLEGEPLQIDQLQMGKYLEQLRVAGLVVLHEGKIVYEYYGLGFDQTGKWTSFSVAKSFTSTLVGAAIKDGYISSLEDKVTDYIPSLNGSVYNDVTVRQLLTMTSGVAWNEDYADPNSDVNQFNNHQASPGMDVTASYMKNLSRAQEPGSTFLYSTGETNLIGLLVSKATGIPLHRYLSEKIWSKIGVEQNASWLLGSTSHEISGCCIQASTRDFALFGEFIKNGATVEGHSILPDGYLNLATSNQVVFEDGDKGYGFQWWTSTAGSFEGRGIFGQGIYIHPELDLVIALNSNWETSGSKKEYSLREELYNTIAQAITKHH